MNTHNYSMGRFASPDERDRLFPVTELLIDVPELRSKYWWNDGWWGDQGDTSMCVVYSWMHYVEDGPVIQDMLEEGRMKPMLSLERFYKECQMRDPWEGTSYDGTSVRAGAKILKELGVIKEYRWAFSVEEVANTLLTLGPMVVGTNWFERMFYPNSRGYIRPLGRPQGGHAYILNGVDLDKELFRIKNSWGKTWGEYGHAYISFKDFNFLLKTGGEACIAFENKMTTLPNLNELAPPLKP